MGAQPEYLKGWTRGGPREADGGNKQRQMDGWFHTPLTRFSGLCSSCVVEAQRVMRDLNMQPTTTASIFWATDLLSPVVKLFPKPALSGSNREAGETTDHTGGGYSQRGGRTLLTADQLEYKTLSPYNREGRGGKGKGSIKHMGGEANWKGFWVGDKEYMQVT